MPRTSSLAYVHARWMAIAYESTKIDGCPTLSGKGRMRAKSGELKIKAEEQKIDIWNAILR